MKRHIFHATILACAGVLLGAGQVSAAGFVKLSKHGDSVLKECNPTNSASSHRCKVSSLPGEPGYVLVASRAAPLIYNDIEIGQVRERVWRNVAKPKLYIFGVRLIMNSNQWDSSGAAFNVNDVFRQTLPNKKVSVAYFLDGASKALHAAGRTVHGLNEFEDDEPERDNTWVDFRIDANAADPDGVSSARSPWLLTKTRAPTGIALNTLGLRLLNSDVADPLDAVAFFTTSYQPNGVPPPEDDDDDDDDDDDEDDDGEE